MATEFLCQPNGGVTDLPGLDSGSLYCITPNTINSTAISNVVQTCCADNVLQKMEGCDYCVIDQPTYWSNQSDADSVGLNFAQCLSLQSTYFNVSQKRASTCHVPDSSSKAAFIVNPGWAVWSVVALVGFGRILEFVL